MEKYITDLNTKVKEANKRLYNAVAEEYEHIDGRRSDKLKIWLRRQLLDIQKQVSGNSLLDIGTGSGLITECAKDIFEVRIGTDLSFNIISNYRNRFTHAIISDANNLCFKDNSFDVITCFSVLHHLYSFDSLVNEVDRVLKPGGIFYSDHDMDLYFKRRFSIPLYLYRKICNIPSRYIKAGKGIDRETYNLSEYHKNGLDSSLLIRLFETKGFSVNIKFHWYGLHSITDCIFMDRSFSQGYAPLIQLIAVKRPKYKI